MSSRYPNWLQTYKIIWLIDHGYQYILKPSALFCDTSMWDHTAGYHSVTTKLVHNGEMNLTCTCKT